MSATRTWVFLANGCDGDAITICSSSKTGLTTRRRSRTRELNEREIDRAREQHLDWTRRRVHVDPDLDARKLAAIVREDGGQPVIAGVALGGDAQDAAALLSHLADLEPGLLHPGENLRRRLQKA